MFSPLLSVIFQSANWSGSSRELPCFPRGYSHWRWASESNFWPDSFHEININSSDSSPLVFPSSVRRSIPRASILSFFVSLFISFFSMSFFVHRLNCYLCPWLQPDVFICFVHSQICMHVHNISSMCTRCIYVFSVRACARVGGVRGSRRLHPFRPTAVPSAR